MLNIVIFFENTIKDSINFNEIVNDNLRMFCQRNCAEFSDFGEILVEIKKVQAKNKNPKLHN